MDDDRSMRDEQAQAEALARALDGESGTEEAPPEALEAAGLLRLSAGAALDEARSQAVLNRVLSGLPEPETPRRSWLRWLIPVGSVAAAAAMVLLIMRPAAPPAAGLPWPSKALLQSQARAAAGSDADASALRKQMRSYRGELFARLDRHYGAEQ
jgi:hypothetical protein